MFVIRVVPLHPLPRSVPQILDYYWGEALPRGCVVQALLGRRRVKGVVLSSTAATRSKLSLKQASYGLKPLASVLTSLPQASEHQLSLAAWIAGYYACGPARGAHEVFPRWLGAAGRPVQPPPPSSSAPPEISVARTDPDATVSVIRRAVRREGQLLVLVPERTVLEPLAARLARHRPLVVHGSMTPKAEYAAHTEVASGKARLVIGTRSALYLPWHSLRGVIVEDANNDAYKSEAAPKVYAPDVARKLASLHGAALTLLVPALSAVQRKLTAGGSMPFSDLKPSWPPVVPVTRRSGVLTQESADAIDRTLADNGRVLIMSSRRAWSGSLRCRACRRTVPCGTCRLPLRVHEPAPGERMLVCYHCSSFGAVPRLCPSCGHGPLTPSGPAGSQRVAAAVSQLLSRRGIDGAAVTVFDTDLLRTPSRQEDAARAFADAPSSVVVATQLILPYRWRVRFDLVIVADADSLAWHPDFRSEERLIACLEKLADFRPSRMLIQHTEPGAALAHAPARSWNDFLDAELTARKALRWPPYVRLASVASRGPHRASVARAAAHSAAALRAAAAHLGISRRVMVTDPIPSLTARAGGRWTSVVLVKSDASAKSFSELLSYVPSESSVDVDPRSIL